MNLLQKCYGHIAFGAVATSSSMEIPPTRKLSPHPLTNAVCRQTPSLLISEWKTVWSGFLYFPYPEWTLSVSEPFFFFFFKLRLSSFPLFVFSVGLRSFFLPRLYIGCCWKLCLRLAPFAQPGGGFRSPPTNLELCLKRSETRFSTPATKILARGQCILLRGQVDRCRRRLCGSGYVQKREYFRENIIKIFFSHDVRECCIRFTHPSKGEGVNSRWYVTGYILKR